MAIAKNAEDLKILKIRDDYIFFNYVTNDTLNNMKHFKLRDSDIIISSFPKSGTHWLSYIIKLLRKKGKISTALEDRHFLLEDRKYKKSSEQLASIFGENIAHISTKDQVESAPSPRIFVTHFPYIYIPKNSQAKYIFIYREPKDVLVSLFNFITQLKNNKYDESFENFYKVAMKTKCFNYAKYVFGYFENSHNLNVYNISYEELKNNFRNQVYQLASFLGFDLNEELFTFIQNESNFESMKFNKIAVPQLLLNNDHHFVRKGIIGDWKTTLSVEQANSIDEMIKFEFGNEFIKNKLRCSL